MSEPAIQYATTTDGVSIAYCVAGQGSPLIWTSNVWNSHLTRTWARDREAIDALASRFTLVRYDGRGCGLSDRTPSLDFSLDARMRDLEAVRSRVGLERFALLGSVHGGLVAAAYSATHPDRVSRLVLLSPYASGEELYRESPSMKLIASLASVTEEQWEFVSTVIAARIHGGDDRRAREAAELYRAAMEPAAALAFRDANRRIDITEMLPNIECPTLIVHREGFDLSLASFARKFASLVPNAELRTIEGKDRPLPMSRIEAVAVMRFLGADVDDSSAVSAEAESGAAMAAIIFTDLVGHSEMMSRLGDERGREVLREHERITREVLKGHGGREVKTLGDGFMASFGSVTRAVECAMALQRAMEEWNAGVGAGFKPAPTAPLQVRVGLNAGEPIEEEGDLFGATVILAARIAAKAEGGEILVADTVRGLCAGKGFLFADRGEFVAKGFEEPVRLYEVRWRDA